MAGLDLTFTAVKFVSVLWALADDQTRGVVRAAHDAAVSQTLGLLETRVAVTRVTRPPDAAAPANVPAMLNDSSSGCAAM